MPPGAASQEELEALLKAAASSRDRFLLVLLWFSGLRIGEALGLRRSDLHFMSSSMSVGCRLDGPHLHVVRRDNPNRASAKFAGRPGCTVGRWVLAYYDRCVEERLAHPAADGCDFVFVNLFHAPLGAPMTDSAVRQLFGRLETSGGTRPTCPPAYGAPLDRDPDGGGPRPIDVVQVLLGHASITSTQVYVHPSQRRMRDAVEAVEELSRNRGPNGAKATADDPNCDSENRLSARGCGRGRSPSRSHRLARIGAMGLGPVATGLCSRR